MKAFSVIFILLCATSCDILRTSPFEVSRWSPGGGYHADPAAIELSMCFSHDPDRTSVERYFSLAEDGERLKGTFRWEGKTMRFLPLAPLEINRDYTLALSAEAHDEGGLSMDSAFEGRFTTRPGGSRPVLLSIFPENYSVVNDLRGEVRLVFSRPMSLNSLYDNISFSPPAPGSWSLSGNGETAVFTPSELWVYGRRYELRLSSSLAESTGLSIGKEILSVFVIGEDTEKPVLAHAYRITENDDAEELAAESIGAFTENHGWEKGDRLQMVFSKEVDTLSVKNCLTGEGAAALVMETPPGFDTAVIFRFETVPVYESRFTFRLKTGVKDRNGNESAAEYLYRIFANGAKSRPPELYGIRMPMAPGSALDKEFVSYTEGTLFADFPIDEGTGKYPSKTGVETWIECYFETAPGASVDPFSLMDLFRVETSNNVLVFSPRLIKAKGFSVSDSVPGWEKYTRLEIKGTLTNSTSFGVVHIQIAPGLADTAGNRSEKTFCISLVK
jgi:hypothetical protein